MRILILSYHLHPDTTAEGLCVAKAARALVERGHAVEVVTAASGASGLVGGIPVHRVAARGEPATRGVAAAVAGVRAVTRRLAGRKGVVPRVWSKVDAAANVLMGGSAEDLAWSAAAGERVLELWGPAGAPRRD